MSASRWFVCTVVTAMALLGARSAMAGVLYSQLDSPTTDSTVSQNFEADLDAYDSELADDFVVPAGGGWAVDTVSVVGLYFNGAGPAPTVHVTFYENSGTLPGSAIAACDYPAIVPVDDAGSFTVSLAPACMLAPGTYWVSVVANMDFSAGGEWGWSGRAATSNNPAVWQNPGGGFGTPCESWGPTAATCGTVSEPDLLFSLSGVVTPLDSDGDGVLDGSDLCPLTPAGTPVDATGCSIAQLCPCAGPQGTTQHWTNHGQYVSCVARTSQSFYQQWLITLVERDAIVSAAGQSSCGKSVPRSSRSTPGRALSSPRRLIQPGEAPTSSSRLERR